MKVKRVLAIILCVLTVFCLFSCGGATETTGTEESTQSQATQKPATSGKPTEIYNVTGKSYRVDTSTINIGWNEGEEPTQIQKDTFIALVKNEFGVSEVKFSDESSFELTKTNNSNHNASAQNCQRAENEMYAELSNGSIGIMVFEDKITMYCDFFAKGWGMYFSIDYLEIKE